MNTRLAEYRGLGNVTNTQIAQSAITGSVGITATLLALSPAFGPAAPFVAALAPLAGYIAQAFAGCGQTCVQATQIVNQIEPYLKQNVSMYQALATPRPKSAQIAAIAFFDDTWAKVMAACSNASLGDAGKRCINDRQRGGKWDWFSYYRDPIANDTNVYDDSIPAQVSNIGTNTVSTLENLIPSGLGNSWLVPLVVVGIIGAMFLGESGKK